MFIESLESRRLLAAGVTLDSATGVLYVTGTNAPDQIDVMARHDWPTEGPLQIDVTLNGVARHIDYPSEWPDTTGTQRIVIDAAGGADQIYVQCAYTGLPAEIRAGAGDDTVWASAGYGTSQILISGGEGNDELHFGDSIVSGPQGPTVLGGTGDDSIHVGRRSADSPALIDGGSGNDQIALTLKWVGWMSDSAAAASTLLGGNGDDEIAVYATYTIVRTRIEGGNGNDHIVADTPVGIVIDRDCAGADCYGGRGFDILTGDANDLLDGGLGQ